MGRYVAWAVLIAVVCFAKASYAQDDATERARQAYARGVQLSKDEHWGDALAQFEEAAAARDAPLVRFNIAYCQRALARYVAARRTLTPVLANPAGLDPAQLDDAKAYMVEFDRVIARAEITLDPQSAALTIDGRALVADGAVFLAGVAAPSQAKSIERGAFTVLFDPGPHLVVAAREGHGDAVVHVSYRAGEKAKLALHLDALPATILINSEPPRAIVKIDGREVGIAPIEFQRAAGDYKLEVANDGYETYSAALKLSSGQRAELTPKLAPYTIPITKRWWFWTGAGVIVVGGILAAVLIVRASQPPPPYDGGTTNWIANGQGFRFGF